MQAEATITDKPDRASVRMPAWLPPLSIGCTAFVLIYLTLASRMIPSADEGIYLQGGVNVLRGGLPHRDFLALTGPGSFWLLAAIFRTAGVTLRAARMLTALDLSVMAALIYWLVSRLAQRGAALAASVLFVAMCLGSPGNVVVNHRWDSSMFSLAAICCGLIAIETDRRAAAFFAGLLAVLAAWITPPVALVAAVIAARIGFVRRTWPQIPTYAAGAALGILVPAGILAAQHGLTPMLQGLLWTGTHYSGANRIGYGAVFGGWAGLFAGAHGAEVLPRVLFLTPFLLPALLPPLCVLMWLRLSRGLRSSALYLLFCGTALVASAYPRWDLLHLLYVSPVFLVLAAVWLDRTAAPMARISIFFLLSIPAAAMAAHTLAGEGASITLTTPAGSIHASRSEAPALQMALANVRPGDSLFVFPYEPFFYFLTDSQNPTRYLWLQPGMMSADDERTALSQLAARPPEWILYRELAPSDYLRIWPGSDPSRLRMTSIEEWIRANYRPHASATSPDGVRQLLKRR
jgi:hypothetical protein